MALDLAMQIVINYVKDLFNDLTTIHTHSDKDLTTIQKIYPVLYYVCIAMACGLKGARELLPFECSRCPLNGRILNV